MSESHSIHNKSIALAESAQALSHTLSVDWRLLPYDIQTNRAHVAGLKRCGTLSAAIADSITQSLDRLMNDYRAGNLTHEGCSDEDVHSYVERRVIADIGDNGKRMHTGKSRNDQVMTDSRLYLKDHIQAIGSELQAVLRALGGLAEQHTRTIFPGFTHFQPAQPIVFAHHVMAYMTMLQRDYDRLMQCYDRTDCCPLGAGAIAGTNYPIDREWVATQLGFSRVSTNSMDAVADRDFMIEFVSVSAIVMGHISRLCEEIVLWASPLIGFIHVGDAFTTGSSLMPQKRNPDIAELIRGKSARVLGHSVTMHHLVKALPLTYNRDLQEDKPPIYDTVDTVWQSLAALADMIPTITVQQAAIQAAVTVGHLAATELADYLVSKSIPFREAHEITGKIVNAAIKSNQTLQDIPLTEYRSFCQNIDQDVYEWLCLERAVNRKIVIGGTAFECIDAQVAQLKELIKW